MVSELSTRVPVEETEPEQRLVHCLLQPEAYSEPCRKVELIETHISWVFLTPRYVYKVKKPVRFDFLDFSTRDLRHAACEAEVALNRRLASDVYLGVVPITTTTRGKLKVDGGGQVVDWAVRMRRLPADRAMDQLIHRQELTEADIERVGRKLADFYSSLPPVSVNVQDYRQEIENHVAGNLHELSQNRHCWPELSQDDVDGATKVQRVHAAQLRFLRLYSDVFDARAIDGRVVEGHGDLRPEHIYLTHPVKMIDCIEFDRSFRNLDVLDELSFFAIETAMLGAPDVGGRILQLYVQATNDTPPRKLLPFYMSYRATVRSKVSALRALQLSGEPQQQMQRTAARYLDLADHYGAEIGPPWLIIVRGLSGTGKSTLAAVLAEQLGISVLRTDEVRRQLFPDAPDNTQDDEPPVVNAGLYSAGNRERVYEQLLTESSQMLEKGLSVILDGTFLTTKLRQQALHVGRQHGASVAMLECQCPEAVAVQRIEGRRAGGDQLSAATSAVWAAQHAEEEANPSHLCSHVVDTTHSLPEMLDDVYAYLRRSM